MRNVKDIVMDIHKTNKDIGSVVAKCARSECVTRADIDAMKYRVIAMQGSILSLERVYEKVPEPEIGG